MPFWASVTRKRTNTKEETGEPLTLSQACRRYSRTLRSANGCGNTASRASVVCWVLGEYSTTSHYSAPKPCNLSLFGRTTPPPGRKQRQKGRRAALTKGPNEIRWWLGKRSFEIDSMASAWGFLCQIEHDMARSRAICSPWLFCHVYFIYYFSHF